MWIKIVMSWNYRRRRSIGDRTSSGGSEPIADIGRSVLHLKLGREADVSHDCNQSRLCAESRHGNMQNMLKLLRHFVI